MTKNLIKELIIVLLLVLAIILLLGILLYGYVPMTKTIPNPVSYTTPENVKEELQTTEGVNEDEIIMTYKIDSNDLNNYKRVQNYRPGKTNPFSTYEVSGQNVGTANSATGEQSTGSSNSNNNSNTGNNSETNNNYTGENLHPDKPTK